MIKVDWVEQFLSYLRNERVYSEKTATAYQSDLADAQAFWQENGGFKGWDQLDRRDVEIYLQALAQKA